MWLWEDCQAKSIDEFGRASQGVITLRPLGFLLIIESFHAFLLGHHNVKAEKKNTIATVFRHKITHNHSIYTLWT